MARTQETSGASIQEKTAQERAYEFFHGKYSDSVVRQKVNQALVTWRANGESDTPQPEEPIIQSLRELARLAELQRKSKALFSPEGRVLQKQINDEVERLRGQLGMQRPDNPRTLVEFTDGFSALAEATFPHEREVPPAQQTQEADASVVSAMAASEPAVAGATAAPVVEELAEPRPVEGVARDDVPTIPTSQAASPAEPAIEPTAFPEPDASSADAPAPDPVAEPSAEPVIVPVETPVVESADSEQADEQIEPVGGADEASSSGSYLAPTELRAAVPSDAGVAAQPEGYSQEPTQPRAHAAAGETDRSGAEEPFGRSVELTQDNLDRAWNIINGMDPSSPQRDEDMAQLLHMLQGDFRRQLFAPENIDLILPQVRVMEQSLQRIDNRALRPRQIEVLMDIARRGSEDDLIFMLRLTNESLRRAVFTNVRGRVSEASRNIWTAQLEHDEGFLKVYENEYTSMSGLAVRINNLMPHADRKQDRDITYSSVREVEALGTRFVNLVQSLPDDTSLSSRTIIDIVTEEVRLGLYRDINDAIEDVESARESTGEYPDDILSMLQAVRQGVEERLYVSHFDIAEDMRLLTRRDDRRVGSIVLFERLREEGISPSDVGLTPEVLASYYTLNETERPMPTIYDAGVAFEDQAAAIVGKRPAHRLLTGMKNRLLSVSPEFIDSDMDAFIEEWVDVLGSPQERRHHLNATQQMRLRGLTYSFQAELRRNSIFVQGVDGEDSILERVQEAQTIDELGTQVITIGRQNEGEPFKLYIFDLVDALRAYAESSADATPETSIAQQRQQFLDAVGVFVKNRGQLDQTTQRPKGKFDIMRLIPPQRAPAREPLQELYDLNDEDRAQVVNHLERFVEYDDYDYLIDAYLVGLQEVREKEADAREQESQPSALREMDQPEQVAVSRAQPGSSDRGGVRPGSSGGHARPSIAPPPMPPGAHEPPEGLESTTSAPPVDDFEAFMRGLPTGPSTRDAGTQDAQLGQVRPRKKRITRDWIN